MRPFVASPEIQPRRLQRTMPTGLFLAVTLFAAFPAMAHHSYAAFDSTQTQTLKGTVSSLQWSNPHVELKLLVKIDDGSKPQEWNIETHSPAIMMRYGWTRSTLNYGDRVSVVCNPMKDGTHSCRLHTVLILKTGRLLKTKLSESVKLGAE